MTIVIADNSPRKTYTATASQTDFPTDFAFFAKADVNVYVNGTLKTLDSDFSIPTTGPSAWTSGNDGTVVFTTGLSAGDTVVLTRDVELERTTDFPSSGPFQVATLNTELDKIVAMIADLEDLASRGITLDDSDTGTTASLPDVTARKGRVLAFENDATAAPKAGPLITDVQSVADVSADIATLADIQDGTVATDAISGLAAVASDVTTAASNITAIQNASANATTATTKATEAATSATAAAASATAAAASETAAETAETNAETAETNAATSATNAATSATSAASSATTATTKASEASTSATNAATSETNASTSATSASTSATAASTSATAAASSATAAAASETAAAASETAAGTSETNASTSATTATTKASEASTSATNAAASATSAASAQSAAESARDSALAAYDNFDDRYLGAKSSDPTVDNDGNALVAGALYFDTTSETMKVYTGSAWVAAYVSGTDFAALSGATFTGSVTMPTVDINGGAIDGTIVGGSSAAAGTFTTLTASGDLTVDTNTLKVDSTNNRVGVANASPSTALDVTGTVTANRAAIYSGVLSEQSQIRFGYSSDYHWSIGRENATTGDLFFESSTSGTDTTRMVITNSGNVGIGTSSPSSIGGSSKLVVNQGADGNSVFVRGGSTRQVQLGTTSTTGYINTDNTSGLTLNVNGSERMRIDTSGNVGIGVSSPSSYYSDRLVIDGGAGEDGITIACSNTTGENYIMFADGTTGNEAYRGYIGYGHGSDYLRLATSGSERMRIDSSGNVGIGTTSPNSKLHVKDSTDIAMSNSADGQFVIEGNGYSGAIALNATGMQIYQNSSARNIIFGNNETEQMRIDSSGIIRFGSSLRSRLGGAYFADDATNGNNGGIAIGGGPVLNPTNGSGSATDNVMDIGRASNRWNDAFITNGVTTGSDQNEKQQIASLTDAEIEAAKRISNGFKTFKWNDAVEAKGDNARIHTGVIAQEVRTALEAEGLNAGNYAFFMSDTWWETQTEVPAVEADEENGIEAQDAYTRTDTYETAEEAPEGATERTRLGIRYPELLAFIGAATEQRLADIETRLTALEN